MPNPNAKYFVAESIARKPWSGPVIDIGAGEYTNYYRDLFGSTEYLTLDFKQNSKSNIQLIADLLDMKQIQKNHYGIALLLETLEHVKDPFLAFLKISQILRPGGMFICTTVAAWPQHDHPADYWRFLMAGLELLCEHANLKVFHRKQTTAATQIPCQVMIAAIKP